MHSKKYTSQVTIVSLCDHCLVLAFYIGDYIFIKFDNEMSLLENKI
jgi:hypothetical protein